MEYRGVWALGEMEGQRIKDVSFELLTRGRELANKRKTQLSSILIGGCATKESIEELLFRGADRVFAVCHEELEDFIVETYSRVLCHLIHEYRPEIILAAATTQGRTLMPYVAIKVKTGLTADCTELDIEEETGDLLQTRPAIGGNIMATIKTPNHRPQMATIRPRTTLPSPMDKSRDGEIIPIDFQLEWKDIRVKKISSRREKEEETNIQEADTIISGGKGLKKGDHFAIIKTLAMALKGKVGSSREAVDRGWISYPHQVGLSGKTVTPSLYVAVGISGAVQHLAGMKTAETIVAINLDREAPIFKVADFGIVGDLFAIAPALVERLKKEGFYELPEGT